MPKTINAERVFYAIVATWREDNGEKSEMFCPQYPECDHLSAIDEDAYLSEVHIFDSKTEAINYRHRHRGYFIDDDGGCEWETHVVEVRVVMVPPFYKAKTLTEADAMEAKMDGN